MAVEIEDEVLLGNLSIRLRERLDLQHENTNLKAEIDRLSKKVGIDRSLLDDLRKHAFWRNDMETVRKIDEGRSDVNV